MKNPKHKIDFIKFYLIIFHSLSLIYNQRSDEMYVSGYLCEMLNSKDIFKIIKQQLLRRR